MLDHISLGVRDMAKSKRFYDAVLEPLGYPCLSPGDTSAGYGRSGVALWLGTSESPVPADPKSGLHVCFTAPTRKSVDAFHKAALAKGGRDNGKPGLARTTVKTTTPPSSSTPTAIASKPIAALRADRRRRHVEVTSLHAAV